MSGDPLLEPRNDLGSLPKPGEVIIYDYTDNSRVISGSKTMADFEVKAVQWNIERAYKLDAIIDLLKNGRTSHEDSKDFKRTGGIKRNKRADRIKRIKSSSDHHGEDLSYCDFDVFAIQEFDVGCARSDYRNSAQELARALRMKCIFLCEFEEIYSDKLRSRRDQGGGVHGNGILTWWDVERIEVIDHVEIFAWERDGEKLNEPRKGRRKSLACFLKHPLNPSHRILVYSVHLEIFCGIFGRLRQFSAILEHSRRHLKDYPRQLILGDLNTMAHGLARFFPKYCCDVMRWRSLGWSEAEWWQRNLFTALLDYKGGDGANVNDKSCQYNCYLAAHHHPKKPTEAMITDRRGDVLNLEQEIENELIEVEEVEEEVEEEKMIDNVNASESVKCNITSTENDSINNGKTSIFTSKELKNLLNPHFFCPFPVSLAKTVEMRGYAGKLDWMLVRGWRVTAWGLDNEGYARSDHKLLWCHLKRFASVNEEDPVSESEYYREAVEAYNYHVKNSKAAGRPVRFKEPLSTRNWWIGTGVVAGVAVAAGIMAYHLINKD